MAEQNHVIPIDQATLLTLRDVKEATRLGETYLRAEIRKGNLPAHKFGSALRVRKSDLDDWIARQAVTA